MNFEKSILENKEIKEADFIKEKIRMVTSEKLATALENKK